MSLIELIEKPIEGFKGTAGFSIKHLETETSAEYNGDKVFPTASVFKIPVIIELFRQVDEGNIDLDQHVILTDREKVPGSGILKELSEGMPVSYMDLIKLMMIVSDNTATDLIVKKVGFKNINQTMDKFGLSKTRVTKYCRDILFDLVGLNNLEPEEMTIDLYESALETTEFTGSWSLKTDDNNITTPNEMNHLLELVVNNKAASEKSCNTILEIMSKCQTGPYRIPKYLPQKKVMLMRKTGSLPGIRNDVGVITIKDTERRYMLSCFTMDAEDNYEAEETIATVSQKVYEFLTS